MAWIPGVDRVRAGRWLARHRRVITFLSVVLVLGPGLLVNGVLKEYSGRARPSTVVEFGGTRHFTRAFVFSDQCPHNCSFVSGHAAAAGFPMTGYFVARSRRSRRVWLVAGLACGMTVGLLRMLTGSHFLSDIVFALLFMYLVAALCAAALLGSRATTPAAESG
jgi:lipid A 4'-phosphatase